MKKNFDDNAMNVNFWGYRIFNEESESLYKLFKKEKYLRQGWGYSPKFDLRLPQKDDGVLRNMAIYNKLKKGDYILVVHFPTYEKVCIARATEDANTGYDFKMTNIGESGGNDFGHMFPAEEICIADYSDLKDILKCHLRFWNLNEHSVAISSVINKIQGKK